MTNDEIEQAIADLLAEAEPLRTLVDDDPLKAELNPIVLEINQLRALQEKRARELGQNQETAAAATLVEAEEVIKRRPGRPRKQ